MSDTRKRELRGLLDRRRAGGMTQGMIATAARVSQPLVSLAMNGRLVAETAKVARLFEYLSADGPLPPAEPGRCDTEENLPLKEALSRLSDGTVDGDIRLVRLLNAIAGIRAPAAPG